MSSLVPALPAAVARAVPPLATLTLAAALSVAGTWLATPLIAVVLAERGADALTIGTLGAAPWLTALLVAPLTPALARHCGGALALHRAASIACAACLIGFGASHSVLLWLLLGVAFGAASCLVWTTGDAMAAALAPAGAEGRALGAYQAAMAGGIAVGPLALKLVAPGAAAFALAAALVLAGLLLTTRLTEPAGAAPRRPVPLRRKLVLILAFPAIMLAAAASGVLEAASAAVLPLLGLELGMSAGTAGAMAGVTGLGGLLAQLPAGWATDRFGTRRTIRSATGLLLAAGAMLSVTSGPLFWLMLAVWGAAASAFMTTAFIALATRLSGAARATAIAGLNAAYLLGGAVGAPAAAAMQAVLPSGLLPAVLAAGVALALLMPRDQAAQPMPRHQVAQPMPRR